VVCRFPRASCCFLVPTLITAGLAIDQVGGPWGQPLVVAATWLSLLWILLAVPRATQVMMLICLVYASIGEVLLSLVWRVYDYRMGNLPLFVPPGHVLLFLLGLTLAPRLTDGAVRLIATAAAVVVGALAFTGRDTFSAALCAVFLLSVMFGRERSCMRRCSCWRSRWSSTARGWATGTGIRRWDAQGS
jgi:hypothetical protein